MKRNTSSTRSPCSEDQPPTLEAIIVAAKNNLKSSQDRKKTKTVTFSTRVRYRKVKHIKEYPDKVIRDSWYSTQEMKQILFKAQQIVDMLEDDTNNHNNNVIDEMVHCTRGLEKSTQVAYIRSLRTIQRVQNAVLHEQDCLRQAGILNPDNIALASRNNSFLCSVEATRIGALDAKTARRYSSSANVINLESQLKIAQDSSLSSTTGRVKKDAVQDRERRWSIKTVTSVPKRVQVASTVA